MNNGIGAITQQSCAGAVKRTLTDYLVQQCDRGMALPKRPEELRDSDDGGRTPYELIARQQSGAYS